MSAEPTPHRAGSARALLRDYVAWHHRVRITESASAVAFWLAISFGPAALVAINIMGLITDQESVAEHLSALAVAAPGSFGDALIQQMEEIAKPSPGSGWLDAVLVLGALWTVSTAVSMLLRGLRRGFDQPVIPFALVRVLGGSVGLGAIIVIGAIAFVIDAANGFQRAIGFTLAAFVAFALILGLYRLAVGRAIPLRHLWPGALAAALALGVIEVFWERLTQFSPNHAQTYGTLAGIVTSLLALWFAAYAVLAGAYICSLRQNGWSTK